MKLPECISIVLMHQQITTVRARKTDLLNRPTSEKWIIKIDPFSCPIATFMLFLDALAQEKYIYEVCSDFVARTVCEVIFP